ncbi:MAG: ATP-binding protein [Pseudomonadota bacterium]|jgi:ATP-binding protein involved in chromosome partitioning
MSTAPQSDQPPRPSLPPLPGVKHIVAVASGKGGVGKSTTAANLALALSQLGHRVGILDADIYGPSLAVLFGVEGKPKTQDDKFMLPMQRHGLQLMSIGFLVPPSQAMIWRGPMASQALDQLLHQTRWDNLDVLIVDMPPGTGDIQLSLSQRVPLTGAIIVTTPQDLALIDARKGVAMFEKVGVPILGLVENMAVHICSQCGHEEHIFGQLGAQRLAKDIGAQVLGALPLDIRIREQADSGQPTVVADPKGPLSAHYLDIARAVWARVGEVSADHKRAFPTIKISKT